MRSSRRSAFLLVCTLALPLTACGGDGKDVAKTVEPGERLTLLASIYPLQYVLQQVAGDGASTSSLAGPNVEPHDMELTPDNVKSVEDADLVLTLKGFQPAVDDATKDSGNVLDAGPVAGLVQRDGATDYHFWLDPARLAKVGTAVATRLGQLDPSRASTFTANAKQLAGRLTALDRTRHHTLATCATKDVFTGHPAFGYLLAGTSLVEHGALGANPEAEPGPTQLAASAKAIRAAKVTTLYAEPLVSDRTMRTLAGETGTKVALLDPIEALSDRGAAGDYPGLMAANLKTLAAGQRCTTAR